jgi:uncharacterized protein YxjI
MNQAFNRSSYIFRKKVFKLFGGSFKVFDTDGNIIFYSEQKAFRLKEDFRIYSDESKREELVTIKTPQILDFSATYHVSDSLTSENIGALKRKGFKSIISDEWTFLSNDMHETGKMKETSLNGALLSRFIKLIPQNYIIMDTNQKEVARIKQFFNPFVLKYQLTIPDSNTSIDRRLIIAAGILLCSIEGRQQ